MKKLFSFLVLCLVVSITETNAQMLQEVVYLKNGSIIRGTIIEQIPGVSLKIKTGDGNVFVYQISEVEKISKEEIIPTSQRYSQYKYGNSRNTSYCEHTPLVFKYNASDLGYRGFVELGHTFGVGMVRDFGRLDVATTHGIQINPHLFFGAGLSLNYAYHYGSIALPFYADIRTDILKSNISPFIDFKIGYSITDAFKGLYLSPTIGCRFGRFNMGISYVMQKDDVIIYDGWSAYWSKINCGGISIKLGIEF